ncbi:MAG: beta-phosphoglucomutase, partial [Erysipelotrichaceae bacterium]|nr:beta-phosphoglucomutase [Erysipelotrichaceae bacterium]
AWKRLADELGIPFNEKTNERLRGVSRMASLEIILEKSQATYTEEEKLEFARRKNEYYLNLLESLNYNSVSPEARNALEILKRLNYKLAIGSSSKNTKFILEKIGLLKMFDAISDGTNIMNSKPDPEVFLTAAKMLGVTPEQAIVVEDAASGIAAAKAGHFITCGIGPMAKAKDATIKIQELSDLVHILLKEDKQYGKK